jgi:biotin transport system substrate-specific component
MATAVRLARVPPFERGITIGDFLVPVSLGERISTRARDAILVLGGTALMIIGARLSFYLPFDPLVPVTGQTFGVLLTGAALGLRRGVVAAALYLLLGAVGLPVFAWDAETAAYAAGIGTIASIEPGWRLVLGTSGGYLVGFVLASALVGRLAELGWDRRVGGAVAALVVGNAVVYLVGLPWLAIAAGLDASDTLKYGLYPFIPGDTVKLLAAAALLPTAWWIVRRNPQER